MLLLAAPGKRNLVLSMLDVVPCIVLLIVALINRPTRSFISWMVFIAFTAHYIGSNHVTYLTGFMYFATAALCEGTLIAIFITAKPKTSLVVDVSRILLASCIVHGIGWGLYEAEYGAGYYVGAMAVLNTILIIRLLWPARLDRDGNIGIRGLHIWRPMVRHFNSKARHSAPDL